MSLDQEGSNYVDSFAEMPSYKWVTMCDGTSVQKIINYDFENAKATTEYSGANTKKRICGIGKSLKKTLSKYLM